MQVPGASRIVSMTLNRKGTRLLVNCYDRAVRLYEICHLGRRRKSYSAADLKTRLAAAKVCKLVSACTHRLACMALEGMLRTDHFEETRLALSMPSSP